MFSLTLQLLSLVPKNILSSLFGAFSRCRFPTPINQALLNWFAKRYGVQLSEAEKPIESYPSLHDFFTRDLREGIRPISQGIVSPVDGAISEQGPIENGQLIQAKGKLYSLEELLGSEQAAQQFAQGYFVTIYLAPGDYHHIHSPISGDIQGFIGIPGSLWPVNAGSVSEIPKLFCQNERVISFIQSRDFGRVAVVKVGATNVGSIRLTYDSFVSNRSPLSQTVLNLRNSFSNGGPTGMKAHQVQKVLEPGKPVKAGERIATFELGSTVILVFEAGKFLPHANCRSGRILLGTQLSESTK